MNSEKWTARTATQLQEALKLSNSRFAEHLKVGLRTVNDWHKKPHIVPNSKIQEALDNALEDAKPSVRDAFTKSTGQTGPAGGAGATGTGRALDAELADVLEWLDRAVRWPTGTARARVAVRLAEIDPQALTYRGRHRARVEQSALAWALARFYGNPPNGYGRYGAWCGEHQAVTSILTSAPWLDLAAPLLGAADRFAASTGSGPDLIMDEAAAEQAVTRLAGVLATDVQLVDMPLYRLDQHNVQPGTLAGRFGIDRFGHYALTMDLLEAEIVDAIAEGRRTQPGSLPLRDRYLPELANVLDTTNRLCVGGALALCAIARPATLLRPAADYVLLIQERSGRVLNAARRLAVIPKGFHQPLTDYRSDARLGATLLREMEEELFGRDDIDNTVTQDRHADPMHPSRLSEPMRWLTESSAVRLECTGFGYNLISGNYEFPGLIIIDDEDFWNRYGGQLEANWEASGLRQVSTLDRDHLTDLASDIAWSNEGLFAYLQGLRRLAQIGGERVDIPAIEWELW
ncbi:hypothetical protein [Sciscionella sediminilitoris]|uniref:hypothetical protein n=1 Tax=Sciscionella sediminilitoris TaxID=1445613 RepID=UPI0004DF373E|nr:hypothetical protein [Sciscionella sp. SE31]